MVGKSVLDERTVDIRHLKELAATLDRESFLRRVLAAEPDILTATEFVAKLGTWLAILREEFR
jgi:hypothetical protein